MTKTRATKPCTCGNDACNAPRRVALGLLPFCQLEAPAPVVTPNLAIRDVAAAHYGTDQLIQVRGGVGHGPSLWVPTPVARRAIDRAA